MLPIHKLVGTSVVCVQAAEGLQVAGDARRVRIEPLVPQLLPIRLGLDGIAQVVRDGGAQLRPHLLGDRAVPVLDDDVIALFLQDLPLESGQEAHIGAEIRPGILRVVRMEVGHEGGPAVLRLVDLGHPLLAPPVVGLPPQPELQVRHAIHRLVMKGRP